MAVISELSPARYGKLLAKSLPKIIETDEEFDRYMQMMEELDRRERHAVLEHVGGGRRVADHGGIGDQRGAHAQGAQAGRPLGGRGGRRGGEASERRRSRRTRRARARGRRLGNAALDPAELRL